MRRLFSWPSRAYPELFLCLLLADRMQQSVIQLLPSLQTSCCSLCLILNPLDQSDPIFSPVSLLSPRSVFLYFSIIVPVLSALSFLQPWHSTCLAQVPSALPELSRTTSHALYSAPLSLSPSPLPLVLSLYLVASCSLDLVFLPVLLCFLPTQLWFHFLVSAVVRLLSLTTLLVPILYCVLSGGPFWVLIYCLIDS